jgi:pimeloyl-ACP methyl ester carboxylesterase
VARENDMTEAPLWFREAIAAPYESRTVEVHECPIHYLHWGERDRPGLVLVHGGAGHAHWWSFIAPQLAHDYQVVAIDLSGHGESGRRDEYTKDLWVDEVMSVARDAGFPAPPVVIGHSMGGMVSIATAVAHGDDLAGIVILDLPAKRPDPKYEATYRGQAFLSPKVYPDRETALASYRLVPDQPCENPHIIDHIAQHSVRQVHDGWTWKFDPEVFRHVRPRANREMLPHVKGRIAIVRAELGLVTADIADYMCGLLDRNAPVVEIPQAHHHMMLDQPLALIAGLRAILAGWEHPTHV